METLFNCMALKPKFPWNILHKEVVYIDGEEQEAETYFERWNVKSVRPFKAFLVHNDKRYTAVACTFLKSEEDKFLQAMDALQKDMLIFGYPDYEEFCNKAFIALHMKEGKET